MTGAYFVEKADEAVLKIALAISMTAWTLVAWGGRVGLLAGGEGIGPWIRIGGSLIVGLFAAATLVIPALEAAQKPALLVFAVFTTVIWVRSLIVNWTGSGALPFKLIHTLLAIGFFALATWAAVVALSPASSDPVSAPDEADSQKQGEGEPTGLA